MTPHNFLNFLESIHSCGNRIHYNSRNLFVSEPATTSGMRLLLARDDTCAKKGIMEKTQLMFCYISKNASITKKDAFSVYLNGFILETCYKWQVR